MGGGAYGVNAAPNVGMEQGPEDATIPAKPMEEIHATEMKQKLAAHDVNIIIIIVNIVMIIHIKECKGMKIGE